MKKLNERYEVLKKTYRRCANIHEDEPTTCKESIERAGRLYRPSFTEIKAVELLDDVEFSELESTANAINHIVDHTVTDDRGDISDALKVGELQGELLTSKLKQDDLYSNTYYFESPYQLS